MRHIFVDFEMNPIDKRYTEPRKVSKQEIIEIGAVMLDDALRQISEFRQYVKPVYGPVQPIIRRMTRIRPSMLAREPGFAQAMTRFLDWCGEDSVFITWSANDIIALEDNIDYHGLELGDLPRCFDIQLMFDDQVTQEGRDFALSYAMWKMEIKPAPSHDALNDAINTAEVMRHLDLSEGLEGYEI